MRIFITLLTVAALALPAAALADEGETSTTDGTAAAEATTVSSNEECRVHRATLGLAAFKLAYGTNTNRSNALGKCISRLHSLSTAAVVNAAQTCKDEKAMADADFMAGHEGKTFTQHYGSGRNGRNAFGQCVASHASEKLQDAIGSLLNAAQTCKAEKAMADADFMAGHEGKTFTQHYGSGRNGRNAFGQCVASHASEKLQDAIGSLLNAAQTCKAEKAMADADFMAGHEGKTFTQHYGSGRNGRNAFGKCVSSAVRQAAAAQAG
jgi:hypothetical protein